LSDQAEGNKFVLVRFAKIGLIVLLAMGLPAFSTTALASDKQESSPAEARVLQGQACCKKNMYDQAEPFFRKALLVDAKCVKALFGLAEVYEHQGRPSISYSFLDTANKLEPENAQCYIEKAKFYQTIGRTSAAIDASKKAVALAPENAEAYYRLGLYQRLGRDQEAEKNLKHALQLICICVFGFGNGLFNPPPEIIPAGLDLIIVTMILRVVAIFVAEGDVLAIGAFADHRHASCADTKRRKCMFQNVPVDGSAKPAECHECLARITTHSVCRNQG
jgi:Tfp pilus assembly protein PilF